MVHFTHLNKDESSIGAEEKSTTKNNVQDFICHKYICKMYILADMKLYKIKIYIETKTTFENIKNSFLIEQIIWIFDKYICKIYKL